MSSAEQSWTKLLLVFNKFGILSIWDLDNLGFGQLGIWDLGFGRCLEQSRAGPSCSWFLINLGFGIWIIWDLGFGQCLQRSRVAAGF